MNLLRRYNGPMCCIEIREGDAVEYEDGRVGIITKISLVPGGMQDQGLVARLTMKYKGGTIMATANHFKPTEGGMYLDY